MNADEFQYNGTSENHIDHWLPVSAGLQQINSAQESWPSAADVVELLEGVEYSDLLTSPSPNNGYHHFDDLGDAMETNLGEDQAGIQMNPENPGAVLQNMPIPFNDPMFGDVPMAPQAQAVAASADDLDQSERIDSSLGSFTDIEPMRLESGDARAAVEADPSALRESLGSIELNAPRNASTQQIDHTQEPGMAAQAPPDSSQMQTATRISPNRPSAEYYGDYQLPNLHHFKVSVKFMSTVILEKDVKEENGCLLHFEPPGQPPIPVPAGVERITIPFGLRDEKGSLREFPWVKEKQKRFTELILKSFDRGVEFSTEEGNVYATRKSNTKLFWHNTEKQAGHALELRRNDKTEVFNWESFQKNLALSYSLGKVDQVDLPAIWFSFAQKWDKESSPITTKLVWARVDPIRACEMVKNVNPDVKSTESVESLHTSLFAISNEASQSAPR